VVALPVREPAPQTPREEAVGETEPTRVNVGSAVKVPLIILAFVAVFAMLDYGQQLFLPLTLAFIVALTLSPVNRWLSRRIPAGLSALILVVAVTAAFVAIVAGISQPVAEWVDDAPRIGWKLQQRFAEIREPVEAVTEASKLLKQDVVIYDTAATALYALNIPVPSVWDGQPILEIFDKAACQQ
jgi:predicted PurR-regulated permease PerM